MEELCKPRYMYVVCILYIYCLAIFIWAITYLQIIMVVVSMRSKLAMTFNIPEKEICISAVYIDWWIIPRELVFIQAEPTIHWTNTFSDSFHMKSQVWVSWCALNQYQFWCNLLNWLVNGRCFFFSGNIRGGTCPMFHHQIWCLWCLGFATSQIHSTVLSQYNYQKETYRLMISINHTLDIFCDIQVPY
jgi:hypothetical protein